MRPPDKPVGPPRDPATEERYLNRIGALHEWREEQERGIVRDMAEQGGSETKLRGALGIVARRYNLLANVLQVMREEEHEKAAVIAQDERAEAEGGERSI